MIIKKFQFFVVLFATMVSQVNGDATGISAGTGSASGSVITLSFDFTDIFDSAAQTLQTQYFSESGGSCSATEITSTDLNSDIAAATAANVQAEITSDILHAVTAAGEDPAVSGTASYCVRLTLCTTTDDDQDCTGHPIVGQSQTLVSFTYAASATAILGDVTAISVAEGSTAFSDEFTVKAGIVADVTDCDDSVTTFPPPNLLSEAFTGSNYRICLYTDNAADRAATSLTAITDWTLSANGNSLDDNGVSDLENSCSTTNADACVMTNTFELPANFAPEGESRAVTGTVFATMIIDGVQRQRKLTFDFGDTGDLIEPISFAVRGPDDRGDDDDGPFFCDGFLGILFFWICWIFDLF